MKMVEIWMSVWLMTVLPAMVIGKANAETYPDLVAIKDGSPSEMFIEGIKALGGMERFIKKGQTVLVKPNIGWNRTPMQGATTNPELVGIIIKKAYEAGAREVWVFDHTCDEENASYKNSGIKEAVEKNNGKMFTGDLESDYIAKNIPGAKILKNAKVHKRYLDADVVINVPILKNHMGSKMTAAMKNLMGVVWDRQFWHREGLHQTIADFTLLRKVDLTVIDAYLVMKANGPRGLSSSDLKQSKMQIISTDMLLADVAAAKILGTSAESIPAMKFAKELGLGSDDLTKANIKRITIGAGKN